jgi:hypothetical protein
VYRDRRSVSRSPTVVATGGTYSGPTTSVNDFREGFLIFSKNSDNPLILKAIFLKKSRGCFPFLEIL